MAVIIAIIAIMTDNSMGVNPRRVTLVFLGVAAASIMCKMDFICVLVRLFRHDNACPVIGLLQPVVVIAARLVEGQTEAALGRDAPPWGRVPTCRPSRGGRRDDEGIRLVTAIPPRYHRPRLHPHVGGGATATH